MALWDVLATVNERLVGISTPHQPRMQEPLAPACATPQGNSGNSGLDKWLKLYGSLNFEIRLRAARALLERPDIPLTILLEIFDQLSQHGLGGRAELALLQRRDPELANAMIARLVSPDPITRAVVCGILGRCNNTAATPHLLRMVEDPYIGVRSAAGWALSDLRDVSAIPELKRLFAAHKDDDINVVLALRGALKSLGVDMGTI